jgi:hypothetical protein
LRKKGVEKERRFAQALKTLQEEKAQAEASGEKSIVVGVKIRLTEQVTNKPVATQLAVDIKQSRLNSADRAGNKQRRGGGARGLPHRTGAKKTRPF